jgi:hypothetical protein
VRVEPRHFRIELPKREAIWTSTWRRIRRLPQPSIVAYEFDAILENVPKGTVPEQDEISSVLSQDLLHLNMQLQVSSPVTITRQSSPYPRWMVRLSRGKLA